MATTNTTGGSSRSSLGSGGNNSIKTSPDAYISLGALLDPNKPDNRDMLVQAYGDQGITGFLELTGAKKSTATADEVQWWEEGRLHRVIDYTTLSAASPGILAHTGIENEVRLNDVLLLADGQRVVVTVLGTNQVSVRSLAATNTTQISAAGKAAIIGNIYAQGTNQPTTFYQTGLKRFVNPFFITKEVYTVNGSQATNIGWINVNGDYRWYLKNEMDARKRFMNQREMMMIYGQTLVNTDVAAAAVGTGATNINATADIALATGNGSITGTEGYFQAVERRGIVSTVSGGTQGTFASLADIDSIILELDKEGAPSEYAFYVNRKVSLDLDDMIATGIATQVTAGLPGQFGAFNNDANMAVQLGFKSFTRGGYTFHKHDWKLLNDPMLGALNGLYKGAMVPLSTVADAKTGQKSPALEMNYKASNNYSRDIEHFVTGSILGYATDGADVARFNYRSECNLVTRAANQHVIIK
jgi:hypothetical protein